MAYGLRLAVETPPATAHSRRMACPLIEGSDDAQALTDEQVAAALADMKDAEAQRDASFVRRSCPSGVVLWQVHPSPRRAGLAGRQDQRSTVLCRTTQLSLLRLFCHATVMAEDVCTLPQAWEFYDRTFADKRFVFRAEPADLEPVLRRLTQANRSSPRLWQDAYLASFALYTVDFASGRYHEETATIPFSRGIYLPRNSGEGKSRYDTCKLRLPFHVTPAGRRLQVQCVRAVRPERRRGHRRPAGAAQGGYRKMWVRPFPYINRPPSPPQS